MKVLDFEDALTEVILRARSHSDRRPAFAVEAVALLETAGRVLAEPIYADRDQPPFDRSTRDGFAVCAGNLAKGQGLRIVGQLRAGEVWAAAPMAAGEAIEIMTGAPIPPGADAVVMIEHVEVSAGMVRIATGRTLAVGDNIVWQGSEARRNQALVPSGTVIGSAEIALAAACGMAQLAVFSKPSVTIIATGDELVEISQHPAPHQIRNSNSYGLAALVKSAGGSAQRLEIARDSCEDLRERIALGRQSDLMLLSGGVSMGKYDLVEEVLGELGAEFFFIGVRMQPGKPVVFGRLPARDKAPECFFFGLPGNPVSTQVTFHCFVEPFLSILRGENAAGPRFVQATLGEDVAGKPGLMRLLPARLDFNLRVPSVRLVGWHGSGDLAANAKANCYAMLPPDRTEFHEGDIISVMLR